MVLRKNVQRSDGTKVFYSFRKGKGPTLVFVHGWVMNYTAWESTRRFLAAKGHSTLTFDIRGHGRSVSDNLSFDLVVGDIKAMITKEKIKDIILIGYSMGGMISQLFCNKHPKDVKGLVLVNTTYINPVRKIPIHKPKLMLYLMKNIYDVLKDEKKDSYFRYSMLKIFSKHNALFNLAYSSHKAVQKLRHKYPEPRTVNRHIDFTKIKNMKDISIFYEGLSRTAYNTAEKFYWEEYHFNLRKEMDDIDVPCLIITSKNDSVCPEGTSFYMKKKIKNSTIRVLEDCDHLSILQERAKVNQMIRGFLKRFV